MTFSSATDPQLILSLKRGLVAAGLPAQLLTDGDGHEIVTNEAGELWLLENMGAPQPPTRDEPKVQSPARFEPKGSKMSSFALNAMVLMVFLSVIMFMFTGAFTPDPPKAKTWKEVNAEKFGLSSDFATRLGLYVNNNIVKYPYTKRLEDYRVLTIEPDSVVVVYIYSAENGFGVRSEHSVTVVGDVRTEKVARIVSVQ